MPPPPRPCATPSATAAATLGLPSACRHDSATLGVVRPQGAIWAEDVLAGMLAPFPSLDPLARDPPLFGALLRRAQVMAVPSSIFGGSVPLHANLHCLNFVPALLALLALLMSVFAAP